MRGEQKGWDVGSGQHSSPFQREKISKGLPKGPCPRVHVKVQQRLIQTPPNAVTRLQMGPLEMGQCLSYACLSFLMLI